MSNRINVHDDLHKAVESKKSTARTVEARRVAAKNNVYMQVNSTAHETLHAAVKNYIASLCSLYYSHPLTVNATTIQAFLWGREVCRTDSDNAVDLLLEEQTRVFSIGKSRHEIIFHKLDDYRYPRRSKDSLAFLLISLNEDPAVTDVSFVDMEILDDATRLILVPRRP